MNITLRDTIEADLPALFRIRKDPLVRAHQFKIRDEQEFDNWKNLLFGSQTNLPNFKYECSTILKDEQIVGHICQMHYAVADKNICYCGWNLSPEYWGKGIATIALASTFDAFFNERMIDFVVADCFSNNKRCIHLMSKLNFQRGRMGLYERAKTAIANLCIHWILRFYLDADLWQRCSLNTKKNELKVSKYDVSASPPMCS